MTAVPAPARARTWRRELTHNAFALWLPVLVPLVTGMLRDCEHCFWTYAAMAPLVPGTIVPAALGLDGAWFFAAAGLTTLVVFAGMTLVLPRLPLLLAGALRGAVVFAVAAVAIGFANMLRA